MGDHGPRGIQNIFWELYILKVGIAWEKQEGEMVGAEWESTELLQLDTEVKTTTSEEDY